MAWHLRKNALFAGNKSIFSSKNIYKALFSWLYVLAIALRGRISRLRWWTSVIFTHPARRQLYLLWGILWSYECCFPPWKPKGLGTVSSCPPGSLLAGSDVRLDQLRTSNQDFRRCRELRSRPRRRHSISYSTKMDVASGVSSLQGPMLNSPAGTIKW